MFKAECITTLFFSAIPFRVAAFFSCSRISFLNKFLMSMMWINGLNRLPDDLRQDRGIQGKIETEARNPWLKQH